MYNIPIDRMDDVVQCKYCNYWTLPEEIDESGECKCCAELKYERSLLDEMKQNGVGPGYNIYDELHNAVQGLIMSYRTGYVPNRFLM